MNRERLLKIHRWIGIIIAIQVMLSFGSALIFAVRSVIWHIDQYKKPPSPVLNDAAFDLTQAIRRSGVRNVKRAELWHAGSKPFYEIRGDSVVVLDGVSGKKMDFSVESAARKLAELQTGTPQSMLKNAERITTSTLHYKGDLPAWRFITGEGKHIYISQKSGKVTKETDRLGRISAFAYEYLHTMKFTDNKILNAAIPIPYILCGLFLASLGIYLFISRYVK